MNLMPSMEHFEAIFNSSPVPAAVFSPSSDPIFLAVNDAFLRVSTRTRAELVGNRLFAIFSGTSDGQLAPHVRTLQDSIKQAIETARPQTMPVQHYPIKVKSQTGNEAYEDRYWNAVNTPIFDADGRLACILHHTIDITHQIRAEASNRESAERVHLATDAASLGLWTWDAVADQAVWENDHMYRMLGLSQHDEPISTTRFLNEIVHAEDAQPFMQAMAGTLESGDRFHFEGRFYRASDRALRWIEFTGMPHFDANGKLLRMVGAAADITERKEATEQLRSTKARLEATLEAGEIGTWLLDIREDRMYADSNMAGLHAMRQADAMGASLSAYYATIHPEDLGMVKASVEKAVATGQPYQSIYRVGLADGQYRTLHARGRIEFDEGVPAWMPGVALDITQQKEVEEKLRIREERYRALFDSIDEAFCIAELILDAGGKCIDHRFLETNAAYEKHTGLLDVVGKSARELVPNIEQRWNDLYAQVAASGESVRVVEHAQALGRWFDVFVSKIHDDANDKVAIVFRDVTENRRAGEELQQLAADLANATRRQNEFLATLAHELRNPLAPIQTGLDLMRISQDNAGSVRKIRETMERQVNHLVHLVNDLMDLARIQSGKIELKKARVALKDVVLNAVETTLPILQAKHHHFSIQVPDVPVMLFADANRIAQVIGNLLTNAAKYTPENGKIGLSVACDGDTAVITVTDNGIGIPAEVLPRLFEMFSQGHHGMDFAQGGLGIGLNLVKRLTEKHGGTVGVVSAGRGLGSTFTLRLPIAQAETMSASASEAGSAEVVQQHPLRILVADDNQDAAELLAQLLRSNGHLVKTAHDGLAALAAAEAFAPQLALLDIGMPGMNGFELAQALRRVSSLRHTVLAAVTGWGSQEDRVRSREAGFDHHMTKPLDLENLNRLVLEVQRSLK